MQVIRSNMLTYLQMALIVSKNNDQNFLGGAWGERESIRTAALTETLKAVENGEQLEIVY